MMTHSTKAQIVSHQIPANVVTSTVRTICLQCSTALLNKAKLYCKNIKITSQLLPAFVLYNERKIHLKSKYG